jgi:hypothetical protein
VRSLDTHEEMEVVGEKGPGEKYDAIAPLSPTEDADQDLVEARAGSQEKSAVKGAAWSTRRPRRRAEHRAGVEPSCL